MGGLFSWFTLFSFLLFITLACKILVRQIDLRKLIAPFPQHSLAQLATRS